MSARKIFQAYLVVFTGLMKLNPVLTYYQGVVSGTPETYWQNKEPANRLVGEVPACCSWCCRFKPKQVQFSINQNKIKYTLNIFNWMCNLPPTMFLLNVKHTKFVECNNYDKYLNLIFEI